MLLLLLFAFRFYFAFIGLTSFHDEQDFGIFLHTHGRTDDGRIKTVSVVTELCSVNTKTFAEMCDTYDYRLFNNITRNPHHS